MSKKSNTKRSDGRIAVQVYLGSVDGKRKVKTVYGKTQKEANEKADAIKAQLRKGMTIASGRDSFSAWANYYLSSKSLKVSENQAKLIESRLRYWKDELGIYRIDSIKPIDIEMSLNALVKCNPYTGKPTSKNTLKSYMQILNSVYDFAIDNRIIDFNPASRIELPQAKPQVSRRALTSEEQKRVVEFEHRGKRAIMLLMFSGLRRGEATALTWNDVDLERNTITVNKSYDFKQNKIKAPKNGKSRTVFVPDILIDYLKTVPHDSALVITNSQGKMMTDSSWKRMLESYLYDMNLQYGAFIDKPKKYAPEKVPFIIKPFTLHCLRHTFCSMMYNAGVDVLTAQQQMGHSDVKTTLEIYTHLDQQKKESDISKLNSSLQEKFKSDSSQTMLKVVDT